MPAYKAVEDIEAEHKPLVQEQLAMDTTSTSDNGFSTKNVLTLIAATLAGVAAVSVVFHHAYNMGHMDMSQDLSAAIQMKMPKMGCLDKGSFATTQEPGHVEYVNGKRTFFPDTPDVCNDLCCSGSCYTNGYSRGGYPFRFCN